MILCFTRNEPLGVHFFNLLGYISRRTSILENRKEKKKKRKEKKKEKSNDDANSIKWHKFTQKFFVTNILKIKIVLILLDFLSNLNFSAHLVYQPKGLIQSCFVCHAFPSIVLHRHLCTYLLATGFVTETSCTLYFSKVFKLDVL